MFGKSSWPSRQERGFTVVEILVGVAISAAIALVLTAILSQLLRGGTKSDLISVIKQDGQSALGTLELNIRESDGVICPTALPFPNGQRTVVIVQNGIYTRFRFYNPVSSRTPANGYLEEYNIPQSTIDSIEPDQGYGSLCTDSTPGTALTDTNTASGISIQNAQFTGTSTGLVGIQFDAYPGVTAGTGLENEVGASGIHFETTVEIRHQNSQ